VDAALVSEPIRNNFIAAKSEIEALQGVAVTNGDSHNHSGGGGAQIAYSALSGLPTLGTAAAAATGDFAAASHAHGNLTSAGAIGSTANLPVITTTSGALTVGAFGTEATNFCAGNDARLSDARTPVAHNQAETTITFTDVTTGNASTTAHGYAPKATAPASGLVSVLAIGNGETVRSDKALFDTTNPAALGSVGPGTAVVAARRDHVHAMPSAADVGAAAATSFIAGAGALTGPAAPLTIGTAAGKAAPSGDVVGTTDTQTLTNKTLTDPAIIGAIAEDVYTITDGAAFEIDPGNGSVQLLTLGSNRTPKATNFAAGESVTLMVLDGSAYSITWTDTTFGSAGVVWIDGTAPTLDITKYTVIELWKVGSQVYGALVGMA
jgi:hypothetical protein